MRRGPGPVDPRMPGGTSGRSERFRIETSSFHSAHAPASSNLLGSIENYPYKRPTGPRRQGFSQSMPRRPCFGLLAADAEFPFRRASRNASWQPDGTSSCVGLADGTHCGKRAPPQAALFRRRTDSSQCGTKSNAAKKRWRSKRSAAKLAEGRLPSDAPVGLANRWRSLDLNTLGRKLARPLHSVGMGE